jgi:cobyrinic acid a,c-diamide synthase
MIRRLVIAGTHSGVGKTTLVAGLIAALRRRGWAVQPFKVGPDYIDPTYHSLAAGRPCRNLDAWMMAPERMQALFEHVMRDAEFAAIEGVMGVYDGVGYRDDTGSTADVAKRLDAPVVLILDAGRMARSAGAMALGYQQFDPRLRLAGFIVNRAGSEHHGRGVAEAIEAATGLPVFGVVPRSEALSLPERHLGLLPTQEHSQAEAFVAAATEMAERRLDLDRLLRLGDFSAPVPRGREGLGVRRKPTGCNPWAWTADGPVIAVARDEAFQFTYEENLELLKAAGAAIVFFSPIHDAELPADTAGIVLSGGFPEVHAPALAANRSIQDAICQAAQRHVPIYAECGGLMYLTTAVVAADGETHTMVGLLPGRAIMTGKLTLGYRIAQAAADSWLLRKGETLRGHEFHYSCWDNRPELLPPAYHLRSPREEGTTWPEGAQCGNIFASYVHLHFWSKPELAERFVAACARPSAVPLVQ